MPIINGEKYACASCIKGHRVSGCTHSDRELHHINPKGRPVKQCEHCRGARKSKSHHARCECGDKKNKDNGSSKVDGPGCGCHLGKQCICGLKKDSPDLKLETGSSKHAQTKAKPRLTSTHSESTLTVFANGHHKPCHRLNNSAHISGAPYKIPHPHSLHGSLPHHESQDNNGYSSLHTPQRSVDNLPLLSNLYNPFGNGQRSVDSLPLTPATANLDSDLGNFGSQKFFFAEPANTMIGSASNSPIETPLNDPMVASQQWPSYLNTSMAPTSQYLDGLSASPTGDYFTTPESDLAIPSAGLNPLWSAADLPLDTNKLSNSVTQPISHSGESNRHSVPGLTTSSSGAQSEMGDHGLFGDYDYKKPPSNDSDQLFLDEHRQFREPQSYRMTSAPKKEEMRPPTSMPISDGRRSMDFDLMQRPSSGRFEEEVTRMQPESSPYQPQLSKPMDDSETLQGLSSYATGSDVSSSFFGNTGNSQWLSLLGDDTFDMPLQQLEAPVDISPFNYGS